MALCARCGRWFRGEDLCESCADYARVVAEEVPELQCLHCGRRFRGRAWDRHRWNIYRRIGAVPNGRRLPR